MGNNEMKKILEEALNNFFSIDDLKRKAAKEAAENYIYEHDLTISDLVSEKLADSFENWFDDIIDDAVESWLENY